MWYTLGPDLLFLGLEGSGDGFNLERIEARWQAPDLRAGLQRAGIDSLPALLAHELLPVGVVHAAGFSGDVHTLLHPRLSDRAARAFFRGKSAELPLMLRPEAARTGARNSLLRAYRRRAGGRLSARARGENAGELCETLRRKECATILARWKFDDPDSPLLAQALEEERGRAMKRKLTPTLLERLVFLFGDGSGAKVESVRDAIELTEDFVKYYYHAAPFRREALGAAWDRCRGQGCATERAEAQQRLGPLSTLPPSR